MLQAQEPRRQEEWAYGLWSFSRVGWQLNVEWWVGFWWGLGGLPLAPQHFIIFSFWQLSFFSGLYFHSVQIVQASNQHRIPMSSSPLIQAPHILIKITTSSSRKNMLYLAFNILSGSDIRVLWIFRNSYYYSSGFSSGFPLLKGGFPFASYPNYSCGLHSFGYQSLTCLWKPFWEVPTYLSETADAGALIWIFQVIFPRDVFSFKHCINNNRGYDPSILGVGVGIGWKTHVI